MLPLQLRADAKPGRLPGPVSHLSPGLAIGNQTRHALQCNDERKRGEAAKWGAQATIPI